MTKRCIYINRYNPPSFHDVSNSNINFSVNRKVGGIGSALRKNGHLCIVLRTTTGKGDIFKKAGVKRNGDLIVITPVVLDFQLRLLTYILNIFLITFQLLLLISKKRISSIIFWDFLPDTVLPTLIAKLCFRKLKIIPDLEEFISCDPLAPKLFRIFELVMLKFKWGSIITSGMNLKANIKYVDKISINGFYAENLREEYRCERLLKKASIQKVKNVKTIVFTGRLDHMRGYREFLNLASLLKDTDYKCIAFGFGQENIVKTFKEKSLGIVETHFFANRADVLDGIMYSTFCFNFLANKEFASGSFPSKLIEYLCLGANVLSNHKIPFVNKNIFYFTKIDELAESIKQNNIKFSEKARAEYRMNFSIENAALKLREIL